MIKVINKETKIGSEIKLRDYSEPLQGQKEITSYSSRYVYPIDFDVDIDYSNIVIYENEMIRIWRQMAKNPYIDFAIDDIVNEMISYSDEDVYPIDIDLNNTKFSKSIRQKIHDEWLYIMKLLRFHKKSYTLLRDWYIDGKQYFFVQCNNKSITDITVLDPLRTKKIIEENKTVKYVYQDNELVQSILEIPADNIIELNSGLMDDRHCIWVSYLNTAYIPLNQLTNIEDALLIYRIARAPERRVFYIDTGQLPKSKAETYMKEVIRNCRNKMEYDPSTGKIKESTLHMSLLDDIYLPRSAEGRGTSVDSLNGGQGLGNLDDLDYFKIKLFRALHVPFTRWSELDGGAANVLGRTAEITRDEVKYRKFIVRLRNCYNPVFYSLLKKQLSIKKIISEQECVDEYENIQFIWMSDSIFAELRDIDILNERLNAVSAIQPYIGTLFSNKWVKQNIMRFTDEEIEQMEKEIKIENGSENPSIDDIDTDDIVKSRVLYNPNKDTTDDNDNNLNLDKDEDFKLYE